jgi:hypothetical protein
VRSVLKVFAELFSKKRLAEGTDKSKFEDWSFGKNTLLDMVGEK